MSARAREIVTELLAGADIRTDGARAWDLHVHDERFYGRVLASGTLGFGESYIEGGWDCEAIDEMADRAARAHLDERVRGNLVNGWASAVARLSNQQTMRRARRVARVHYDLGNEFFAAMLGPTMQYSCAYFRGTDDLDEAQRRKMDLICRKLGLRPGLRLLDIGCGWGGLARHAATAHGCTVLGVTISSEQQAFATEWCRGLPVEIRLQDYRQVTGEFDRVVSVGMLEHVGYRNYREFMEVAARVLHPEGLFLCHSIGGQVSRVRTDPWIERYIFPRSLLPSPAQVTRAAEALFVLEDVHNFGADYDRTLLGWARNFEATWPQFAPRYGERFGRMWRYYLLGCAGSFRARTIDLFQFVFSKRGVPGGYTSVR
ncbi:MAG: cyclopropane fatty acyl phospholipid synthase [Verrucomicrobia bacterium]|nr:cyclopropane fatty acyl phospholipid synthase [Verrucomicrobiota bacterium]